MEKVGVKEIKNSIKSLKRKALSLVNKIPEAQQRANQTAQDKKSKEPRLVANHLLNLMDVETLKLEIKNINLMITFLEEELALITGTPVKYSEPIKISSAEHEQRSL